MIAAVQLLTFLSSPGDKISRRGCPDQHLLEFICPLKSEDDAAGRILYVKECNQVNLKLAWTSEVSTFNPIIGERRKKRRPALFPVSQSRLGTLLPLLIRGNNYESGQVIKLKHKWLHEPGWLFYKLFPGLIKEKYGSAHPQCHSAGKNEEKKAPATNFNKSM